MKKSTSLWSTIGVLLVGAASGVSQVSQTLPTNVNLGIALAAAVGQILVVWKASNSNPDGTPAQLPYNKEQSNDKVK